MEQEGNKTLKEKINELNEVNKVLMELKAERDAPKRSLVDKIFGKKATEKEYKLPGPVKRNMKRKVKKNYAIVIYIRSNGYVDINYAPIVDDMIFIKQTGLYHLAMADYVMRYKNYPVLIIKEWGLEPISPEKELEKDLKDNKLALPQKVIINLVKSHQMDLKKGVGFGGMNVIWIGVIVIAAIFLIVKFLLPMIQGTP